MPKEQGLLRRLLIKVTPQFIEDWRHSVGGRFRKTTQLLSDYNQEHLRLGEKVDETPSMLWRAAEGAASAQHAKAEADYAKAETDRMDAELRRRTLEAKTRHECADADKAEAEARIANIKEMQARVELFNQLNAAGVSVTLNSALDLVISPAPKRPLIEPAEIWSGRELESVEADLITVKRPKSNRPDIEWAFHKWCAGVGSRLKQGDFICELMTIESPPSVFPITAPFAGMIIRIFPHADNSIVPPDAVMAMLLRETVAQ